MKYKLGNTLWVPSKERKNHFVCLETGSGASILDLEQYGATTIDDKPETYDPEEEWGDKSKLRFDYKDEPEKIEPSNIDFKSKTDWQAHFVLLENKLNQVIDWINNHEKEE